MKNVVVEIKMSGNRFNAWDADGVKWTSKISNSTRKGAFNTGMALEKKVNKNGKDFWSRVPMSVFEASSTPVIDTTGIDIPEDHAEVLNFIHGSFTIKPKGLVMKELMWK